MLEDQHPAHNNNAFARFWRGEYSLPFSYWVVSILGNLVVVALIYLLAGILKAAEFNPYSVAFGIALAWLLVGGWSVFQLVGVWRSASRYRNEKAKQNKYGIWGGLAQLALILGAISTVSQFLKFGMPQLQEGWRMAFQNDSSIPDYTIRVMRNGTELEIAGGFKYGLVTDVEKVIDASPQIKIIHLNSVGGRLGEAEKLGALIRARGLDTYTSSECLSACAIAFAAGRMRWLKSGARLGYHAGSFAGRDYAGVMRSALSQAGLDASFISRAISYSSDRMWYPTPAELTAARAISGTVDSYRFAVSGYGIRPGTEEFASALRGVSIFRAIEEVNRATFVSIANELRQGYVDGKPEGLIFDELRDAKIAPLIVARLPDADDETLIDQAVLIADQYDALGARDGKLCYEYAVKGGSTTIVQLLGKELTVRELALSERVLRSTGHRPAATKAQLEASYRTVFAKLMAQNREADVNLLVDPDKVKPAQYGTYCRMASMMFREIARLPSAEAGRVVGEIFRDMGTVDKK